MNRFIRPELQPRMDELDSAQGNSKISLTEQIARHLDLWADVDGKKARDQQLDDMYKGYAEP